MISNYISLDGNRKLYYIDCGDKKGFPLFFFHGWPGSRLQGTFFDKIANKNKIRLITTDRPGFGLSDYYENRTLLDFADDIAFLDDSIDFAADHLTSRQMICCKEAGIKCWTKN